MAILGKVVGLGAASIEHYDWTGFGTLWRHVWKAQEAGAMPYADCNCHMIRGFESANTLSCRRYFLALE
jgi:hypothetical protein